MRIAPDGGYGSSASSDTNTNTPTPAQQQAKVTAAQTTVNQDKSQLQSTQNTLSQVEKQDDARVQQMMALQRAVAALQAQLKADQEALAADQKDLSSSVSKQVTQQTSQAVKTYGQATSHAPGAPTVATATSGLETATFNQEVLVYEQNHGGQCWVPGSKQWQQDAQALLADPASVQSTRDVVASQELSSLSGNGLDVQHFGAMEWAGETVARAQLQDPQSGYSPGAKPTLAQEAQGEQNAINSLSSSLTSLPNSGVDPTLARQALFSNQYVSGTLGQEIVKTMQSVSTSSNKTQADGIGFLYHLLGTSSVDPQLATTLISAAAPTLQSYLKNQSSASNDQASQAYAYTAGLYDVLENAQEAGVPGASALAGKLAQWSFAAANATNASLQRSGGGRAGWEVEKNSSQLDGLLQEVQQKIKQQHLPSNLLFAWGNPSHGVSDSGVMADNQSAWANFNTSVQGDASLKARPLAGVKIPTTATPGLTADQVHSTYDNALNLLSGEQQNGSLPSGANSTTLAAIQTEMAGGYGAKGDDVALARAMISSQQQQLDQTWQQKDNGQCGEMPVNALNTQAASQVAGMSSALGVDAKSWSAAVTQGDQGMQASTPNAPSQAVIDSTNDAYANLQKAEASGNQAAIATAQQGWDEALTNELQSVYGNRFSGYSLLSDDENGNWRYMAEVQVMQDHATSTDMIKAVSNGLEASEIVELSVGGGQTAPQSVVTLDQQLAPLQQKGADPGGITQAVLNDARVQGLINGQVTAATSGSAGKPTAALEQEAKILAPYEANDPNGVVSGQIIKNTLGSNLTTEILSNAKTAVGKGQNVLSVAAPLMQAAQLSPSLTLAVYHAFDLPAPPGGGTAGRQGPTNQLVAVAGSVNSAADYRNLAIIYAALPDDPQTVGVSDQLTQAQGAKSALLQAFGTELNQPNSVAGQNIKSWIQSSFSGSSSAPAWLANDLVNGYQFDQGGKTQSVGKLGNSSLVSTIQGALYQSTGKDDSSSIGPNSVVDMTAAATADGSTLQEFTSKDALTRYVAQAYGLQPTGAGTYNPNTVVFGTTTLGQIISGLERQAGITNVSAATPIVMQAAPVTIGEQQAAEFRVQKQDGSTVWLGADGSVTQDWSGQDSSLTHNVTATTLQVVGGVTEHDAAGGADPLLKTDTVKAPPKPWWEDVAKDALALTAAIVVTAAGGDIVGGIAAAFAVEQLFDLATHDGEMTVFQYADDAIHGKVGWKETEELGVDSGIELINAVADAGGAGAASAISGKIATAIGTKVLAGAATEAVTETATAAATETVTTATTETVTAATTETATSVTTTAASEGTSVVEAATGATSEAGGTAAEVTGEQAAKEAAAKAAAKAAANKAAKEAGLKTIKGRLLASAGGAVVQQTIQGGANLATNSITMASQGDFKWSTFAHLAAQQGVNLAVSTATGGVSGMLPANFVVQMAAGFGTNMGQTEVDDRLFNHGNLTRQDVLSGLIMMVPTTLQQYADRPGGLDMMNQALTGEDDRYSMGAAYHPAPKRPELSAGMRQQIAAELAKANAGDPSAFDPGFPKIELPPSIELKLSGAPDFTTEGGDRVASETTFGGTRRDRKAFSDAATTLRDAHFTDGQIGQVKSYLEGLSPTEGRRLARRIQALGSAKVSDIKQSLLDKSLYLHDGATDAHMVGILADLPAADRQRILDNASALFDDPGKRASFDQYLSSSPGEHTPASDAAETAFLLWQPETGADGAPDRETALNALKGLRAAGSANPDEQAQVGVLFDIAEKNTTPVRLVDLRTHSSALDPLTALMKGSTLFPSRSQQEGDYRAAAQDIYGQMLALHAANAKARQEIIKADGPAAGKQYQGKPFRVAIHVGAEVTNKAGDRVPSAYGPLGAVALAHSLQQVATQSGVNFEVRFVTDKSTAPVLEELSKTAGVSVAGISSEEGRMFRDLHVDRHKPDAFVSLGRDDPAGASWLDDMNARRGVKTYAITDGTSGTVSRAFTKADHSLSAFDLNAGGLAFAATALDKVNSLSGLVESTSWNPMLATTKGSQAIFDDARFQPGLPDGAITDSAHESLPYRIREAVKEAPKSPTAAEPDAWRNHLAAQYEHARMSSDPDATHEALNQHNQVSEAALPTGLQRKKAAAAAAATKAAGSVRGQLLTPSVDYMAKEAWGRTGQRTPLGDYPSLEDLGDIAPDKQYAPKILNTPRTAQADNRTINESLMPGPLGWVYDWALRKFVVGKDAQHVVQTWRQQVQTLASQNARYLGGGIEYKAPKDAGADTSYFGIQGKAVFGDFDSPDWAPRGKPEATGLINAIVEYGGKSVDPNIRDTAADVSSEFSDRLGLRLGWELTGPQKEALQNFFRADRASPVTASKAEGARSQNALAALSRLFENTRFSSDDQVQAARNLSGNGSIPDADILLTADQSKTYGDSMLDAWDSSATAPSPDGREALTQLLQDTNLTKSDLHELRRFVRNGTESPDPVVRAAADKASKALAGRKKAGPVTPELMDALVPMFKADAQSRWIGGNRIEPTAKGTLSFRAAAIESEVTQATSVPKKPLTPEEADQKGVAVLENAYSYIRLKTHSKDPEVRAAAKSAYAAAAKAVNSNSTESDQVVAGLQGLQKLLEVDKASPDQQKDRVTGTTGSVRTDKGLAMKDAEISERPDVVGVEALVETIAKGSPLTRMLAGLSFPIYTTTFDFSENVNRSTGFAVPKDPNDPNAGYRPNLIKINDKEYALGAPAYTRVIANRVQRFKLPIPSKLLTFGLLKASFEIEIRVAKNLYSYQGEFSPDKVRAGWTLIPAGTVLTPRQARLIEIAFDYGKAPYTEDGEQTDNLYGIYQLNAPVINGPFRKEPWRNTTLGGILPREGDAKPRRVMDRVNTNIAMNVSLNVPFTETLHKLTHSEWAPSTTVLDFQFGTVDRYLLEHKGDSEEYGQKGGSATA